MSHNNYTDCGDLFTPAGTAFGDTVAVQFEDIHELTNLGENIGSVSWEADSFSEAPTVTGGDKDYIVGTVSSTQLTVSVVKSMEGLTDYAEGATDPTKVIYNSNLTFSLLISLVFYTMSPVYYATNRVL